MDIRLGWVMAGAAAHAEAAARPIQDDIEAQIIHPPEMREASRYQSKICSNIFPIELFVFPIRLTGLLSRCVSAIPMMAMIPGHASLVVRDTESNDNAYMITSKANARLQNTAHDHEAWGSRRYLGDLPRNTRLLADRLLEAMHAAGLAQHTPITTWLYERVIMWGVLNSLFGEMDLPEQITPEILARVGRTWISEHPNEGTYCVSPGRFASAENNNNCRTLVAQLLLRALDEAHGEQRTRGEEPTWTPEKVLVRLLREDMPRLSLIESMMWVLDDAGFYGSAFREALARMEDSGESTRSQRETARGAFEALLDIAFMREPDARPILMR